MHDILKQHYQVVPTHNTKLLNVVYAKQEESRYLACDIGDALLKLTKPLLCQKNSRYTVRCF